MIKIGVVILNYKSKELTLRCIKAVKASDYSNLSIFVVDNNSNEGLEKELEKDVFFIQAHDNLGYSGGNNLGIKEALNSSCDFVFILNPDVRVEKNTISLLLKGAEKYSAGIINPKIYFENSKKIWFAGGVFDKANVLGSHRGVNEEDKGQYDRDQEIDFATGAIILIKAEVFQKVGLFDERYFLYYEDSDLSFRAFAKGFKIMYLYQATAFHKNAQSTGLGSSLQDYFITRNRLLFASKFLPLRTKFALVREALKNIGNPTRRLAFLDFLMGKFGRGNYKLP